MQPLPAAVQHQIELAIAEMRSDPTHHLASERRRTIYLAFGELNDIVVNNARCWLPILTAQHVFPIWQIEGLFGALPSELLATAIGVLNGTVDDDFAYTLENKGYRVGGNGWGLGEFSWNAITAGNAAGHALTEVRAIKPLVSVDEWYEAFYEPTPDTASVAAIAFSSGSTQYSRCDPDKLQEFWEWWLNEAIPTAWQRAQS